MDIQYVDVSKLIPNPKNPRLDLKKRDETYCRLKRSIEDYDYIDPIIWNKRTGYIISGHQRLQVMKDIAQEKGEELKKVQVSVIEVDEKEQDLLTVALNKVGGKWDENTLERLLGELKDSEYELGFSDYDVQRIYEDTDDTDKDVSVNSKFGYDKILEQFCKDVQPITKEVMCSWMMNRGLAKWQFNGLCMGDKTGENISVLFTPQRLNPLLDRYGTYGFNHEIFSKIYEMGIPRTIKRIPSMLWDGVGGSDYETDFPPYLAREIYMKYVKEGMRVGDINGRFGGRIIGFASCMFKNVIYEVHSEGELKEGLSELMGFLRMDGKRNILTDNELKGKFDFILSDVRTKGEAESVKEHLKDGGCCVLGVPTIEFDTIVGVFENMIMTKCLDYHRDGYEFLKVRGVRE